MAITDLKYALELDPHHVEANRLFKVIKIESKKQERKKSMMKNGEFLLPIGINPIEARKLNVFEAPKTFDESYVLESAEEIVRFGSKK